MKIMFLDEQVIADIGQAFGYYDYSESEKGLVLMYRSQEMAKKYICSFIRSMLASGFLYSTGDKREGVIAYYASDEKMKLSGVWGLCKGFFTSMSIGEILRFAKSTSEAGVSLEDRMKKAKKPYLFVGMVCVREEYQGQGYMRKVMELAFREGNKRGLPVILDTDAKSKCDKYVHLGMEVAGTRTLKNGIVLYDLIKYPTKDESKIPSGLI